MLRYRKSALECTWDEGRRGDGEMDGVCGLDGMSARTDAGNVSRSVIGLVLPVYKLSRLFMLITNRLQRLHTSATIDQFISIYLCKYPPGGVSLSSLSVRSCNVFETLLHECVSACVCVYGCLGV